MGDITMFTPYNARENRTTNYCLLVLKTLYEENPKYLGEVLGEGVEGVVGVNFRQQERKKSCVPDGLIIQQAFTIYIETKNGDCFDETELKREIEALHAEPEGQIKILIALGNFESSPIDKFKEIRQLCEGRSIRFVAVSFYDLLSACQGLKGLTKNLADMLDDFEHYLDEGDLLPSWEDRLDVANCAQGAEEVLRIKAYLCPASFSHRRSKFFGLYRNKSVERVALIKTVVVLESSSSGKVLWVNLKDRQTDDEYIREARAIHDKVREEEYPLKLFLLDHLVETDFRKTSPGGLMCSKTYFDVGKLKAKDAKDLADKLREKDWNEFEHA